MNTRFVLFSMFKADFLERTRRSSFRITLCLVLYLGYAVNIGQVLIKLESYRGVYNSAWVGSLMALVITFLLGIFGFFLVKDTIERDECSGVGQILAATPLTRPLYLFGKWLSNFALLTSLVGVLALAAVLMQLIQHEDAQVQIGPLIAPLLCIALPMMALVAAFALFFETVRWLKGGFGNLVYFCLFAFLWVAGVQLAQAPWLDVTGISLVGTHMKAAARAAFPTYNGSFVLSMISDQPLQTFVWSGMDWTVGLVLQRMLWLVAAMGVALLGCLFFNRFDPTRRSISRPHSKSVETTWLQEEPGLARHPLKAARLTALAQTRPFHFNFLRLVGLECLLLVKGLKWYWLAGMAVVWVGCAASPAEGLRKYWFMLAALWPVLLWSKMGEREARWQAEELIYQAAYPLVRLLLSSWLAGILMTAAAASGVLLGRLIFAEPIALVPWVLSVGFIPTLGLTLGVCSRSSKLFEGIYPILWYLGPFNPQNQLAVLDYLGVHAGAPVHTAPLWAAGLILLLLFLAFAGRRRQMTG
jgi:hypothetical protein